MKKMFYTLRFLMYPIAALIAPCKVMDKEKYNKYEHGQLIISNHLSWMDIAYQLFWIPSYKRLLSKKENAGNKLQRWFIRNIGIIFVDCDKPELSSMRECINALKDGETLLVYPEGTRNRVNREIQEMHSGASLFALKGNATVVPIVVHHKGRLFKRNYLGVGDPVDLSDLYAKRVDESVLNDATERFRIGMQTTLDRLDEWVENEGWKTDKKNKRAEKKALEKQYRSAKRGNVKDTHSR